MQDFHLHYRYSYRHSHLHCAPAAPYGIAFDLRATLFYRSNKFEPAASVSSLFPIIYGANVLDQ